MGKAKDLIKVLNQDLVNNILNKFLKKYVARSYRLKKKVSLE
jgi:hypothetical protein